MSNLTGVLHGSVSENYPEELYYPIDGALVPLVKTPQDLHYLDNFDQLAEGSRVAIYVFAGTATVKIRREALLIDEESKIVRGPNPAA